jgi:hypothetical protein
MVKRTSEVSCSQYIELVLSNARSTHGIAANEDRTWSVEVLVLPSGSLLFDVGKGVV